jgi:hypothetical protein
VTGITSRLDGVTLTFNEALDVPTFTVLVAALASARPGQRLF